MERSSTSILCLVNSRILNPRSPRGCLSVRQGVFLLLPPGEREEILKVSHLPRWPFRRRSTRCSRREPWSSWNSQDPVFYSWLFLVEKVVIDLSSLNNFVTIMKFKMETIALVLGSVRRGDWMFSIDLQDSYFQIPVHRESSLHLCFCLEGCVYQLKVLCFGLCTAPQVFSRVFALVLEWVHPSSGRLAGGCGVAGPASSPSGPSSPTVHRSRDFVELEEVRPCSFDSSSVPRHDDRYIPRASVSTSGSSVTLQRGSHIVSPPSF